ncbi:MAG: hypothetical protein MZV63_16115 [Marinilabiliales bacterium]|nr:hypothetical protein [Marinilabiliales bacterium]
MFENNIIVYRQSLLLAEQKIEGLQRNLKEGKDLSNPFHKGYEYGNSRGELPAETRAFYGLATNDATVPSLYAENELLSWGRRIIEGEEFRIRKGGSPITNPTIAVVKIRFEHFIDSWTYYNTLAKRTFDLTEKNNTLRKEADESILQLSERG